MKDQELRNVGLKVTAPRLKVLAILEEADPHHLSAEAIYKKLIELNEDVGLATVYRVLTQFDNAGLVQRHNFEGGYSVYELNHGEPHDHMVCVSCNNVEEFRNDAIEQQLQTIAKNAEFNTTDHSLTLYGICKSCHKAT